MKKIFMIATLAIFFASCSKEKQPSPVTPSEKKLVEIKNMATPSDIQTYSYDGEKVIKVNASTHYLLLEYSSSKLIKKNFKLINNAPISTTECDLDAVGRVTVEKYFNPEGQLKHTASYTYDANGYLINTIMVKDDGEVSEAKYTISGGNVVHEDYYVNGVLKDATDYFYDLSVISKGNFNMEVNYSMKNLFGTCFKNPISGYKRTDGNGVLINHATHTYQYDSDGYPTSRKTVFLLSGQTSEYQFKYQ